MTHGRTNISVPSIYVKPDRLYLYNCGDECEEISGGWYQASHVLNNPSSRWGTITKGSNCIKIGHTPSGGSIIGLVTKNTVDLSNYTKIVVTYSMNRPTASETMNHNCFASNDDAGYGYAYGEASSNSGFDFKGSLSATGDGVIVTDVFEIANLTEHHVGISRQCIVSGYSELTLYAMWLE